MNIEKIRNAYDPEFDISYSDHSPPVTWVEMELAEEVEFLKELVITLSKNQINLSATIDQLMISLYGSEYIEYMKNKPSLGDTDE